MGLDGQRPGVAFPYEKWRYKSGSLDVGQRGRFAVKREILVAWRRLTPRSWLPKDGCAFACVTWRRVTHFNRST